MCVSLYPGLRILTLVREVKLQTARLLYREVQFNTCTTQAVQQKPEVGIGHVGQFSLPNNQ